MISNTPHLDECRLLILKVIEQAIKDFLNLEYSTAPIEQYHYQTAVQFLFNKDYYIDWGTKVQTLTELLDQFYIETEWIQDKIKELKRNHKNLQPQLNTHPINIEEKIYKILYNNRKG